MPLSKCSAAKSESDTFPKATHGKFRWLDYPVVADGTQLRIEKRGLACCGMGIAFDAKGNLVSCHSERAISVV